MMERIKKGLANVLNNAGEPLWDEEIDKVYKKYNDELFFDECIGAGLTCRQIYNTDSDNYIKRLQATFDAFFDAMDAAVADQWFWEIPIDWDVLDPKEREKIKCKGRLDYPAFKERYLRQQLGKKHKIPPGDPNGVEVDPLSDFDEILQGLDIWHDLNFTLDRQLQIMYEGYTKCSVCQDPSIYEETPKARNPQNNAVQ
jgi:restriction endonuclease S subunit